MGRLNAGAAPVPASFRTPVIVNNGLTTSGEAITIPEEAVAFTMRVVDSTGEPVAWSVSIGSSAGSDFHFTAGEGWAERDLRLTADLTLFLVPDAASRTLELIYWT